MDIGHIGDHGDYCGDRYSVACSHVPAGPLGRGASCRVGGRKIWGHPTKSVPCIDGVCRTTDDDDSPGLQ